MLIGGVDAVSAGLAQTATHTLVREHHRSKIPGIFHRISSGIDVRVHADKFNGVIACVMALIDAQLTSRFSRVRQTRL